MSCDFTRKLFALHTIEQMNLLLLWLLCLYFSFVLHSFLCSGENEWMSEGFRENAPAFYTFFFFFLITQLCVSATPGLETWTRLTDIWLQSLNIVDFSTFKNQESHNFFSSSKLHSKVFSYNFFRTKVHEIIPFKCNSLFSVIEVSYGRCWIGFLMHSITMFFIFFIVIM